MINPNILEKALIEKFTGQLTKNIVCEGFLRALPFNKQDMALEMLDLKNYANNVLDTMHPETLIAKAMEANIGNPKAMIMLGELYDDIYETATEAAKRVVKSADKNGSLLDIVDDSEFTKEELKKFKKKGSTMSMKEIGNIINKKVVNTIKSEKMEYNESEALKDKLSDALSEVNAPDDNEDDISEMDTESVDLSEDPLSDEDGGDLDDILSEEEDTSSDDSADDLTKAVTDDNNKSDKSFDSYIDTVFSKYDVQHPISLFSRLQEVVLESVLHTNEIYGEIPYGVLEKVTLESTFDAFEPINKSLVEDLETLTIVSESYSGRDISDEDFKDKLNTSTLCAIVIYTLLETLKTIRLYSPSVTDVQKFVNKPTTYTDAAEGNIEKLKDKFNRQVFEARKLAKESESISDLRAQYESFTIINSVLDDLPDEYAELKVSLESTIGQTCALIKDRVQVLNKVEDIATESVLVSRDRDENVSRFNSIARVYGKHPSINEMRFILDPANESTGLVSVQFYGQNGVKVDETLTEVKLNKEFGSYENCVLESIQLSKLPYTNKALNVYHTDTCKLTPVI